MRQRDWSVALFAAVAMTTPATAQVTAGVAGRPTIRMTTSASAAANANVAGGRVTVTDSNSQSRQYDDIGVHSLSAQASARDSISPGTGVVASVDSLVSVGFSSPARGVVTFSGASLATSSAPDGRATTQGGQSFEYFFTTVEDVTFSLLYDFSAATLGCCGNRIELADLTRNAFLIGRTIAGQDTSGSLAATLSAGSAYRLTAFKGEYSGIDSADVRGIGVSGFNYRDTISFDIEGLARAVPEPGTWMMLILGFGATGAALRTRREGIVPRYA